MTAPRPASEKKILIVEDALDDAFFVKELLRSGPTEYSLVHAQDGDSAIRILQDQSIDLLITDLNLPGVGGVGILEFVAAQGLKVPSLVLTGYTTPEHSEKAFAAGAGAVMHKPIDRDEFVRVVRELLHPPPPTTPPPPVRRTVLAIGARPGDVAFGCGGTLAQRALAGEAVLVIHLSRRIDDVGAMDDRVARRAVKAIGGSLFHPEIDFHGGSTRMEVVSLLEGTVHELSPEIAYVPSPYELDPLRRAVHEVALEALADVPTVLTYASATSTGAFQPNYHVDIGDELEMKQAALVGFEDIVSERTDLNADFAKAEASRWGEASGFGSAVEPFMVIRSKNSR